MCEPAIYAIPQKKIWNSHSNRVELSKATKTHLVFLIKLVLEQPIVSGQLSQVKYG